MFKASIEKDTFDIVPSEDGFMVNDKPVQWDKVEITPGYFHVVFNQKSYTAEVVRTDPTTKTFHIKVNNHVYPVQLKDKFDLLLEKMGMNAGASAKAMVIKAPMPGLIIDLKVKAGDEVKPGDALLILEAMKMENIIKSPGQGIVKNIKAKKGDSVEKNQVIIEF
jgi:biotin carboxyl carrier protein